jgi:NAD-dependent SIR2 family protein deacetylase
VGDEVTLGIANFVAAVNMLNQRRRTAPSAARAGRNVVRTNVTMDGRTEDWAHPIDDDSIPAMAKTVVILGAGASKPAGVPVINEFIETARALYDSARSGISRPEFALAFNLIDHYLPRLHVRSKVDLDNIENVFSLVEMGRLIGRLPGVETSQVPLAAKAIRRLVVETVEQTCMFDIDAEGQWSAPANYYTLLERASDNGSPRPGNDYALVTFNYDIGLDFAAWSSHIPVDYGLGDAIPGALPLLKLHGSLHWNSCLKCSAITPIPFERMQQLRGRLPRGTPHQRPFPALGTLHGIDPHCPVGVNAEPAIVPPTWNKTEYSQAFAKIWQRAAKEISEAREIYIVGYSMPASDAFFTDLIALSLEGGAPLQQFAIVNPDPNVAHRAKQLLGPAIEKRFRASNMRFEQWVGLESWQLS